MLQLIDPSVPIDYSCITYGVPILARLVTTPTAVFAIHQTVHVQTESWNGLLYYDIILAPQ